VSVVVTFVNAKLDESTMSSVDDAVQREQRIVAEFRRLLRGGSADLDPESSDMASALDIELRRLGLDIEIVELRERDSVYSRCTVVDTLVPVTEWNMRCVRSSMPHGSETWPVRKENEVALQRAEMTMVRWMCDFKVKDRVPSKELRERLGIDDII